MGGDNNGENTNSIEVCDEKHNDFRNKSSHEFDVGEVAPGTTVMFAVDMEDEDEVLDAEWAATSNNILSHFKYSIFRFV